MNSNQGLPCPEAIQSLSAKMQTLSGMIHELCSISGGDKAQDNITVIKNAVDYCNIRASLFANIFMPHNPVISEFNVDEATIEMVNLLSRTASYQLEHLSTGDCFIQSDRFLLQQALFVLLKHVETFFLGEEGILEVETGNIEASPESPESRPCYIEFRCRLVDDRIPSGEKKRVLIVDDEEAHADIMLKALTKQNFDVRWVTSGFLGLDFINDHIVDLIILDLGMLFMPGTEMLETLRKNQKHKNIPVLVCSGKLAKIDVEAFLKQNARFNPIRVYLKPLLPSEFILECKDFIGTQFEDNRIQKLLTYDLEEAILSDPMLRMGLYPVVQICDLLGFKISIKDEHNTRTIRIRLEQGSMEPSATDWPLPMRPVSQNALEQFYSNFRHELKNKLVHISGVQILIDDPSIPLTIDEGRHIFSAIDECESAIDEACGHR